MDVKRGDKVKFLNESGGGIVVNTLDNGQVLVQIEDGFEIPVLISQLIKTESSEEKEISAKPQSQFRTFENEKPKEIKKVIASNVKYDKNQKAKPLFAIIPLSGKLDTNQAKFELFLLNDGNLFTYYTVAFEKSERLKLIEKGDLEPELKVKIGTFDFSELISLDSIVIDIIIYGNNEYPIQLPIHFNLNMKSLDLLHPGNYKENDFFYEPALLFDLLNANSNEKSNKFSIKDKKLPIGLKPEIKGDEIEEVDLHIDEIVDDFSNLSNGEILNIQMARFTTTLEGAINGKTKKMVFIHGVGNGKLRYELQKTLDTKYPDLQYQDASFAEYGYGATMVIVKKNG